MICGLLRYWGLEGYLAAFFPPGGGDGPALCMVRWTDLPRGFDLLQGGRWGMHLGRRAGPSGLLRTDRLSGGGWKLQRGEAG